MVLSSMGKGPREMGLERRYGKTEGGEQGKNNIQSPSQSCNKVGVTSAEEIYPKPWAGLDSVVRWDPREKQLLSKLLFFIVWFVFLNKKMHPLHYMTFLAVFYTSTQWVMPLGSPVRQSTKPTWWDAQPSYCLTLSQWLSRTSGQTSLQCMGWRSRESCPGQTGQDSTGADATE